MTLHPPPHPPLEHGARWLWARAGRFGAIALIALASCSEDARVDGQVFISGVKDTNGNTIAVAVDFVPTRSDADLTQVALDMHVTSGMLLVSGIAASSACLRLPSSGRLTLAADGGKLTTDARVLVVALRASSLDFQHLSTPIAAGGSAGGVAGPAISCPGVPIDDAIWPNPGATALPSAGGAPPGGAGGVSGSMGGEGGSENAGMGPGEAGMGPGEAGMGPGEAGMGGTGIAGSSGMGDAGDTGAGGAETSAGKGGGGGT